MIYILIPVYNEDQNIRKLSENLQSILPSDLKTYVFVDDGSHDGTCKSIEMFFKDTRLVIIKNEVNKGPGYSFNKGFNWILKQEVLESDLIVTLEGDNTSDLSILPKMKNLAEKEFDLVLASVYMQGGKLLKTNLYKKILSLFANLLMVVAFKFKLKTLSSFYRVYRVGLLQRISEKYNGKIITENGFICMVEILLKAVKLNAKIIEVPVILLSDQRKGKSKMNTFKTSFSYLRFILKRHLYIGCLLFEDVISGGELSYYFS